jgi:hypothetical protein
MVETKQAKPLSGKTSAPVEVAGLDLGEDGAQGLEKDRGFRVIRMQLPPLLVAGKSCAST